MNAALPTSGGNYALIFHTAQSCTTAIGALGEHYFNAGYYTYVGSAQGGGGLQARVCRHLSIGKQKRWHMDYLRDYLQAVAVWWHAGDDRLEHHWVELLPNCGLSASIKGFGASDSRHPTHLFYSVEAPCFARFKTLNSQAVSCCSIGPDF